MNVYIVLVCVPQESCDVVSVWASREGAEAFVAAQNDSEYYEYEIEEWELREAMDRHEFPGLFCPAEAEPFDLG